MSTLQHIGEALQNEMSSVVGLSITRLVLAAFLGLVIGLEREIKHRPAGLRTNMFICFGAALFTVLSDQLQNGHASGDHTRIAAQIIPGIGFIGAGSILHGRGDLVTGLTSAATLFVVASIGMAVGGGLYLTAIFATLVILLSLFVLGRTEQWLNLKVLVHTYEVSGPSAKEIEAEVNEILDASHLIMENVRVAEGRHRIRVQFDVEAPRREQRRVMHSLEQSEVLKSVVSLGPLEVE